MAADSLRDFTLGNLDPEQRAAVTAPAGPVCILAGAGTGKTRAITHRIAHRVVTGQVQPGHVLAVTFTARAAAQLRERLGGLAAHGVPARTFHAAALRQLRYFAPRLLRGREMPELVTSKARLVTLAATKAGFRTDRIVARDLAGEIEWAKSSLIEPDDYVVAVAKAERETPLDPASVVRVYTAYEQVKRTSGVMDFEDLLRAMIWGIEEHPDVAEQVRDQYRHFVVDEYQDVNPLQQRLLEAWLGRRSDLTVVGDVAQTIYSFTGASAGYLMDFARTYRNATVVRLVRDYRSTPEVVALANTVISQARGAEARLRLDLIGQRPSGPKPDMRVFIDEPAEATAVARRCAELIAAGTPASEIAVLFRANAQSEAYEEALSDTGVPYVVRGGERFFERAEVRQAMLALRSATKSTSELAMPDRVAEVLRGTGWEPDRPPAGGANRERWEAMAALYRLATELSQMTMLEFATELERRSAAQHIPTVDGVTLASLHSAKGLEWDAVFLVGLVEGTLPTAYAKTPQAVEEERRLLYVGITRARQWLWLSYGQARSPGGRARKSCRFLPGFGGGESPRIGLPREKKVVERRAVSAAAPCRICGATLLAGTDRKLGRCATCPSDIDETLMANLQEWRRQTAADQSLPAYVVFTDATLVAIAERKPERTEELVAIAGIGPRKLDLYGADVLALVSGASSDDLAAKKKLATEP
ncbi:DNA helicase-2/ATP-dependent DNA helicase PcrA [Allocatelliglobosispora scoriae]|uniref:DNA 3'-5' helicase n=1 Tax=Allocatelliglobosispora scoriae TaxID=643052 RepID=A0A841BYA2_9ACTN|nr:ATP-dependent DNA helicase UvrD2 [Allocatelliglobosispora scoriae]MBB5871700.1 DNA helicase-2/ATP-dependent DNA helicase PcrA [Allocatelliglobosispora scoriae]